MSSLDRRTLAFVIPVKDGDRVYKLYVPMPSRLRVENIAPILGHIFSVGESKKFSKAALLIVAKDYEYYAKEACQVNAKRIAVDELDVSRIADELLGQFRDFLQAVISMAQVVTEDGKLLTILEAKLSEEAIEGAMGQLVFFYCIFHYASAMLTEASKKDLLGITSLTPTEYANTLQTLSSETENVGARETQ